MASTAKKPRLWVSRDSESWDPDQYELWSSKPRWNSEYKYWTNVGAALCSFCAKDFEKYTGIHLEPGTCKRVSKLVMEL